MIKRAGALLGLVIALMVIAPSVAPIQPSYATSGSMAPAISEGDLYFVETYATPDVGDVITFYSPREGTYVTHRIVGQTDDGFVTQGDANPSTDQATGHPPVERSRIVGRVLTVGARPLTVSNAGPMVRFLRGHRLLLIGLAVAAIVLPELLDLVSSNRGRPEREIFRADHVLRPLFVASLAFCLVLMVWSASTHTLVWVAVSGQADGTHTVRVGEEATREIEVETVALVPSLTSVIVEAEGMEVTERTREGSVVRLSVSLPAIEENGPYRTRVHVYPYPATLPRGVLEALHGVHWLAAALGSMVPVFGPVWLLYVLTGEGRVRVRGPRSRWIRRLGGD